MPTVTGAVRPPDVNVNPIRNSFHVMIATKIPTEAIPGRTIGSITEMNVLVSEAPSTRAASRSSFGTAAKYDAISRIANGRLNSVFTRIRPGTVPSSPRLFNST